MERSWTSAVLTLLQRRRRWNNVSTALYLPVLVMVHGSWDAILSDRPGDTVSLTSKLSCKVWAEKQTYDHSSDGHVLMTSNVCLLKPVCLADVCSFTQYLLNYNICPVYYCRPKVFWRKVPTWNNIMTLWMMETSLEYTYFYWPCLR